jgi:hypothetical protein
LRVSFHDLYYLEKKKQKYTKAYVPLVRAEVGERAEPKELHEHDRRRVLHAGDNGRNGVLGQQLWDRGLVEGQRVQRREAHLVHLVQVPRALLGGRSRRGCL